MSIWDGNAADFNFVVLRRAPEVLALDGDLRALATGTGRKTGYLRAAGGQQQRREDGRNQEKMNQPGGFCANAHDVPPFAGN